MEDQAEYKSEHTRVRLDQNEKQIQGVNTILTEHIRRIKSLEGRVDELSYAVIKARHEERICDNHALIEHLQNTTVKNKRFNELYLDMQYLNQQMDELTKVSLWRKLKARIKKNKKSK